MPTFSAIALDRLLEPGSRNPPPPKPPLPSVQIDRAVQETTTKRSIPLPKISPALYATPERTPLPDSPSSFSPYSPYIVNHKRRGPGLGKNLLEGEASGTGPNSSFSYDKIGLLSDNGNHIEEKKDGAAEGYQGALTVDEFNEEVQGKHLDTSMVYNENLVKPRLAEPEIDLAPVDFFDVQDTLSTASISDDDSSSRLKPSTLATEFYDALDDISGDDTARSTYKNSEDELHEMRTNLLMEVEKRKQVEALENMQNQWRRLSSHLSLIGLRFPVPSLAEGLDFQSNLDPADDLSQQIVVALNCARAEVELEMESQIAAKNFEIANLKSQIEEKNFEIARLSDRLHYYEAANREMSQRNQEAVEMARQQRIRRRRRRWIWASLSLAITIGGAAIAWSYLPPSNPVPSDGDSTNGQES